MPPSPAPPPPRAGGELRLVFLRVQAAGGGPGADDGGAAAQVLPVDVAGHPVHHRGAVPEHAHQGLRGPLRPRPRRVPLVRPPRGLGQLPHPPGHRAGLLRAVVLPRQPRRGRPVARAGRVRLLLPRLGARAVGGSAAGRQRLRAPRGGLGPAGGGPVMAAPRAPPDTR